MGQVIERRGRRIYVRDDETEIRAYAPGDGHLSFVASYQGSARGYGAPSREECEAICPYGWIVYMNGPNPRARPAN